jgi:hypothetical protein
MQEGLISRESSTTAMHPYTEILESQFGSPMRGYNCALAIVNCESVAALHGVSRYIFIFGAGGAFARAGKSGRPVRGQRHFWSTTLIAKVVVRASTRLGKS